MRSERHTDEKEKADNDDEVALIESRIRGRVLNLFCASVLELCCTEVESFVLIESSYSADFALQCGKAWNRNFVGREFCNIFVLIRDSGLCLFVKKSFQRINPSFRLNQLYKTVSLIARLLLEPE